MTTVNLEGCHDPPSSPAAPFADHRARRARSHASAMSPVVSSTSAADGGLKPGTPGPIVPVSPRELSVLVRRAIGGGRRRAVWTHLGNEAAVRLDSARASVADGIVLVGLTLDTLETGPQELTT